MMMMEVVITTIIFSSKTCGGLVQINFIHSIFPKGISTQDFHS